jgi:hypothetical protein
VLALCAWVVAHAVSASTAQAQCSASGNPSPPPPVQANFSNQSFGMTPPLSPYAVTSLGIPGCDGSTGGFNQSGGNGSPGQPGGQINGINNALTIIGGGNGCTGAVAPAPMPKKEMPAPAASRTNSAIGAYPSCNLHWPVL